MQPQDAYEVHSAPASETSEAQREGTSLVIWEGMVLTGILVVVCYRFVLQLPFFFDDLPIMTWLGRHGWRDVFLSHEGNYYRPLAFAVYKWGTLFPVGFRQGILHAVNLLLHWINAIFVIEVTRLCEQGNRRALLAGALFSVFPFWSEVVPWITAMPHLLVTTLSLIAVYAALRAERDHKVRWWSASLLAMVLAPLAHESGVVCGVLVGGVISIRYGLRLKDRRTAVIALGCILNAAFVLVREIIPNVAGAGRLAGLIDLFPNSMYFLHGLLYPLAPLIGQLVQRYGWHDFTLLGIAAALWSLLLAWLIIRGHHRRWMAQNLWWWAVSALPAIISLRYASLFISARVYALSSVGITMLWTHILAGVSERIPVVRGRRLALILTTGMIVLQNMIYIFHERASYTLLNSVYQRVLSVSAEADYAPLGFVNLPAALEWQERVYPVIKDSVVFVPPYSNIAEFIAVNQETSSWFAHFLSSSSDLLLVCTEYLSILPDPATYTDKLVGLANPRTLDFRLYSKTCKAMCNRSISEQSINAFLQRIVPNHFTESIHASKPQLFIARQILFTR